MGMKISEIITDKYKLRIPPSVYYDLLADVQEVEEEQEPTTKNNLVVDTDKLISDCEKMSFDIDFFNKPLKVVALDAVKNIVNDLPSVTPQESKTGYWKAFIHNAYHGTDEDGEPIWREVTVYHCSQCNRRTVIKEKFCPNCGAKMVKLQESEDKE